MKRIAAFVSALLLLLFLTAVHAEQAPAETPRTTRITARFAAVEEGRQLMRNRTLFHEQINDKALAYFLQKKGGTLEEYIEYSAQQVLAFTPEEEQRINDTMSWLQDLLERHGLRLPDPGPVTFVKTTAMEIGGAAGYTSGGTIFLNELYCSPELTEDEYLHGLITHELSHCLSRLFPEYRQALYSLISFTVLDQDIDIPEAIQSLIIANPDVEHHNSFARFTVGGGKKDCYLVLLTDSEFEKAGDTYIENMYPGIVPLDGSGIYRQDEAEDFTEVVGRNTDYVTDPEEVMAMNFSYALMYLEDGYERFGNPEILEGIIAYLEK